MKHLSKWVVDVEKVDNYTLFAYIIVGGNIMNETCDMKTILVDIQENGLIYRADTGLLIGKLKDYMPYGDIPIPEKSDDNKGGMSDLTYKLCAEYEDEIKQLKGEIKKLADYFLHNDHLAIQGGSAGDTAIRRIKSLKILCDKLKTDLINKDKEYLEYISTSSVEIVQLENEIEQMQQWVDDSQSGMYVNCVYCGYRYGPKEDTPVAMTDILKEHIEQCPKHPMSKLKIALVEKDKKAILKQAEHWQQESIGWQDQMFC